ncbi:MAG TPA: 50S ribosomal protein L25 [Gemmatimonadaceae bacterium]|nr:50S ribosomal protein L25 [Gemmatimonadaceae bacterium]
MSTATLGATRRTTRGKGAARKLRQAEQVPGIIYGHNREPEMLTLDARALDQLLDRFSADTTVVELSVDGTATRTLIREIQRHPFKRRILHIDFLELVAGEKVTVDIPLVLIGTPEGVKNSGGILDQILRELSVEVDPAEMPNHIDLDVTALGLNDSLHVRDLKLPAGLEALADPDATVCVVVPPRVEAEPTPAAETEETAAEPELIRKPKGEEEEEQGE